MSSPACVTSATSLGLYGMPLLQSLKRYLRMRARPLLNLRTRRVWKTKIKSANLLRSFVFRPSTRHGPNLATSAERLLQHSQDSKDFATPEQRFQTLLQALPVEYAVIRDAMMLRTHLMWRWACRNFRRRRHNSKHLTMFYGLDNKDRTRVTKNVKT